MILLVTALTKETYFNHALRALKKIVKFIGFISFLFQVRVAALEVYERRALISYDIEGLLHEQMNNISAVMFKFHLPEAHPNRQIVLRCPDPFPFKIIFITR